MFTEQELSMIIDMCDLTTKTHGLKAAVASVNLAIKCEKLLKELEEAKNKPSVESELQA